MKKYFNLTSTFLLVLALVASGCKKEKEEDNDTESSRDDAQAESIFSEINEIADQAVIDGQLSTHRFGTGGGSFLTSCATVTVTIDSLNGSGNAVVDFGTHFCLGADSKYRKGAITVSFTGPYRNPGTVITMTATNYYVGHDSTSATKVTGERKVTNNGLNLSGHLNYSIEVNATLVNYLNQQMNWHSTRNREWIAGDTTAIWNDDEYLVTGSANGKSFSGTGFSASITQALHVILGCQWRIVEGKFTLTPEGKAARNFDFGDGTCDVNATVTIGDKTYEVNLR